jgi:hypothetical protein
MTTPTPPPSSSATAETDPPPHGIDIIHLPLLDEMRHVHHTDNIGKLLTRESRRGRSVVHDDEEHDGQQEEHEQQGENENENGRPKTTTTTKERQASVTSTVSVTSTTRAEDIVRALLGLNGGRSSSEREGEGEEGGWLIPGQKTSGSGSASASASGSFDDEDKKWRYKRWMPTMVLYDEIGLRCVRFRWHPVPMALFSFH